MATRRTTSGKRERERAKQAKAAAKRERRLERGSEEGDDETVVAVEDLTTEELLARMEALHEAYDAGKVSFEEFDEQKNELTDRIAISLSR